MPRPAPAAKRTRRPTCRCAHEPTHPPILARFGIDLSARIGHGGEATVYALDAERVLRVYHGEPHDLAALAPFYQQLASQDVGFATPRILEHGTIDGLTYSVDRRIPGRAMMDLLPELRGNARRQAFESYFDGVERIRELRVDFDCYGEVLRDDSIRAASWPEVLLRRMERSLAESAGWLPADVPGLDVKVAWLRRAIEGAPEPEPVLVHGDYFPGNVMMDDDLRVSGVIDFGPLTCVGDAMMDMASAIVFLEVARGFEPEDLAHGVRRALERHGASIGDAIELYRAWYAIRFSPYKSDDEYLYAWCVESLCGPAG
jgi:aminoglycoside phosphotransferase (APT) family kinase protein